MRMSALAPADEPIGYVQHDDGSWSFLRADGWPISPEEFYAEVRAVRVAMESVEYAHVDAELLTAVLRGLTTAEIEPISAPVREV